MCVFFQLGLVCFRVIGSELLNETLLRYINASGLLHMVPARVNDKYLIRFSVNAENLTEADIGRFYIVFIIVKIFRTNP